jgi:hypothetical protein
MSVEPALSHITSDGVTLNVAQTGLHVSNLVDFDRLDATVRDQFPVEAAWTRSAAGDRVFPPMNPDGPVPPARRDEM